MLDTTEQTISEKILTELSSKPSMRLSEIKAALSGCDGDTVSVTIGRMKRDGLVDNPMHSVYNITRKGEQKIGMAVGTTALRTVPEMNEKQNREFWDMLTGLPNLDSLEVIEGYIEKYKGKKSFLEVLDRIKKLIS